jgi:hypothetical protein
VTVGLLHFPRNYRQLKKRLQSQDLVVKKLELELPKVIQKVMVMPKVIQKVMVMPKVME